MDFKQFDFLHLISVSGWEHLAEKAWAFGLNLAAALLIFFWSENGRRNALSP
ncbi:small conductance mechanosensitive ion channel domain protein [Neisseria meningitidis 61103]|nr:small conductance mechanosensitive ion channel domain protein [Neisseria meningitidis 61103]